MTDHNRTTEVWYCEVIGEIRACSDAGGDALSIESAKELREELNAAIHEAEEVSE